MDVGAAELQGASDVTLFWPTDWDGDSTSFGLELTLGLDPFGPDVGTVVVVDTQR